MKWNNYSDEDIERLFNDEVRDKKRTGRGAFSKKGKGVKHNMSGVKFPYDFLSKKEKKALNGEMIVVSGLGKLMSLEELDKFDDEKKKEILTHWRTIHTSKVIMSTLEIDQNAYYRILYSLGVKEKPKSYYEPKTSRGNLLGSNRYSHLTDATKQDIMTENAFERLSDIEKYNLLNVYGDLYTTESIGKLWNKSKNHMYNYKYQIKKRLEKAGLLPTPEKKERANDMNKNGQVIETQLVTEPPVKEVVPTIVYVANEESENPTSEQSNEQLTSPTNNENDHVPVQSPTNEEITPQPEIPSVNVVDHSQEINELKELVYNQSKMFQDMMLAQQQLAATQASQAINQQVQLQAPTPVMPTYVAEPVNRSEMTFSFEDQKEGFMLYQDIKRFISVIERNPDIFQVEIKITRKDQQ